MAATASFMANVGVLSKNSAILDVYILGSLLS